MKNCMANDIEHLLKGWSLLRILLGKVEFFSLEIFEIIRITLKVIKKPKKNPNFSYKSAHVTHTFFFHDIISAIFNI
jgi:hypothetical protein